MSKSEHQHKVWIYRTLSKYLLLTLPCRESEELITAFPITQRFNSHPFSLLTATYGAIQYLYATNQPNQCLSLACLGKNNKMIGFHELGFF